MRFVPIRTYDNYVPAHIDMGLLREEGIESWLKDEHSVTVNPVLTNALAILIREQAAYIGTLVCPACGSGQFLAKEVSSKPASWLESMMAFFLGNAILGTETVYHCMNCNHEFREPVASESGQQFIPD
jgi:hypothetical protein